MQDLIWKPTCMKLNMINYEYYQTTHMHNWKKKKKRSDELAKGNKKEQMLLLAAKIQPYAHTNVTYKYCLVHSHTELWWLCIFASPEQIYLTKNNFMLYQGILSCYISQVVTYNVICTSNSHEYKGKIKYLECWSFCANTDSCTCILTRQSICLFPR